MNHSHELRIDSKVFEKKKKFVPFIKYSNSISLKYIQFITNFNRFQLLLTIKVNQLNA